MASENRYEFEGVPVVVEAWHNVDGGPLPIPDWMDVEAANLSGGRFAIETKYGTRVAELGDWIVRIAPGQACPVADEVFRVLFWPTRA